MTPQASIAARFLASMPQGNTTLMKKDMESLLLDTGGTLMACGGLYDIVPKRLGGSVFRITLRRTNP